MAIQRGPKIVTSGLVFAVDAANRNSYVSGSGTTWTDLSGNNNNGTLTNRPSFSATNGGNFDFNGTTQYVNCGSGLDQASSFSISVWAKRNGIQGGPNNVGLICSRSGTAPNYKQNYQLGILSTNYMIFNSSSDSYKILSSLTQALNNTWYEITGTYDTSNNTMRIYINGLFENSTTLTVDPPTDGSQLFLIGASDGSVPGNYFKGSVANVKIYNRLLSDSEVLQNYNAAKARFGL